MAKYVHDDNNNRIEALSKEEIYALLAAAIQQGQLPSVAEDTAFVTMIKSIVDALPYKIGLCTQAQYNELEAEGELQANALYIITDDETYDEIIQAIDNLGSDTQALNDDINALQSRVALLENVTENLASEYRGNAPYINVSTDIYEHKTVTTPYDLTLTEGTELYVKFSNYGSQLTWNNMDLNVNQTGALPIAALGSIISVNDRAAWTAGDIVRLVLEYNTALDTYVWNVQENITKHIYFGTLYEA